MRNFTYTAWSSFVVLLLACAISPAAPLDQIGVIALRAVTTNVNGSGIRVAQVEASLTPNLLTWQVKPADVGQPTALFSYFSADGTTNNFPNALGTDSWHAKSVADNFYAMPGGVATNVTHVDNFEADYFITNYIGNLLPMPADVVVNQSFTFGNETTNLPTPTNYLSVADQQEIDAAYDNYASTFGTLFISAVNNGGAVSPPGTAYNSIGVAAYGPGAQSSIGPTLDNGRCKPDITAPSGDYTSWSTPLVAGAATLLMQAAGRGDGGSDTNSAADIRTIKALLLNGAVKPLGWTNSSTMPLDARYGAGVVNVLNSYQQLAGGKQACIATSTVPLNATHPPTGAAGTVSALSGWNFATNTSGVSDDSIQHYYFNVSNAVASVKFIATATLVWSRTNYSSINSGVNNLDLLLYNTSNSNLVAASISYVNNVEHLYITNLAQGRYDLQVWKAGGVPGVNVISAAEPYALAWEFVPPPTLTISGSANPALAWPVYPAGFCVEARTNLLTDMWRTNGFAAPTITNGMNSLNLNRTNAAQFFRLRKPNL